MGPVDPMGHGGLTWSTDLGTGQTEGSCNHLRAAYTLSLCSGFWLERFSPV